MTDDEDDADPRRNLTCCDWRRQQLPTRPRPPCSAAGSPATRHMPPAQDDVRATGSGSGAVGGGPTVRSPTGYQQRMSSPSTIGYEVRDGRLLVLVVPVGDRRPTYRRR